MRTLLPSLLICLYASIGPAIAQVRAGRVVQSETPAIELDAAGLAKALSAQSAVRVPGILFETGKASIRPESAAALAVIGEVLKRDVTLSLDIQGHADDAGDNAANLRLSQARVAAVRAYLIKTFGVAADRLTATGFGDTQPVKATAEGRAQNVRIELVKTTPGLKAQGSTRSPTDLKAQGSVQSGTGEWTGRVRTGMMAIGGETTGILLVTDRDQIELQPADQAMRQRLQDLNGKTVTIRGTLETVRGVEIRSRRIIKVTDIQD
jgi:outer membrane protein OmpA-like peptidoglycan-associated protein